MRTVFQTLALTVAITLALISLPNHSNFPPHFIIPVVASLTTKYILGDWDEGYQWSKSDILYWFSLICTSLLFIRLANLR